MKMAKDLSILIPARNEMFLAKTVEDILANIEADTEIIVVLDGAPANPPVPDNERINIISLPESIGQRAATNMACRLSGAKYIMKVDAHCAFDKGFDRKMIDGFKEVGDNVTMVPTMRNLWAFDWKCYKCGWKKYQGPTPTVCPDCGETKRIKRKMIWVGKERPQSNSYCFDQEPHFQYFNEYTKTDKYKKELETGFTESMSLQGSCFMMTRDKYWELNVSDESFGSWGSQGIEVACKTWLSGGRVLVNHKTWYAHMFRTQGGDFGFPYSQSGKQVDHAKKHAREIFFDNKWEKQIYPLSWLIEKFWPVKGWDEEARAKLKAWPLPNKDEIKNQSAGIVYYTDNQLDEKIMKRCQEQIKKSGLPIVSVSLQPIDFGDNIVLPLERSYLSMFKQMLVGLEKIQTDVVFFCEHDVLYHPTHFQFRPSREDLYYYNKNVWQLRPSDGFAVKYDCKSTSQLCADRKLLIEHYKKRVAIVEKNGFNRRMGFEPGGHNREERVDDFKAEWWISEFPNVDIKHGKNLTEVRWKQSDFRNLNGCRNWQEADEIPGWGKGSTIISEGTEYDPSKNNIPGWMEDTHLLWLFNMAKEMASIVEVGSWKGRSIHALLSGCKGTVYAVDHFLGSATEVDTIHAEAKTGDVHKVFMENVGDFKNLQVLKMDSVEAVKQFKDKSVDMVFIDAGHTYEEVLDDIKQWLPKTRKMICGHDWLYPEVQKAVREVLGNDVETNEEDMKLWIKRIKN